MPAETKFECMFIYYADIKSKCSKLKPHKQKQNKTKKRELGRKREKNKPDEVWRVEQVELGVQNSQ